MKEVYPRWLDGESFFTYIGDWAPWPNTDEYSHSLTRLYFGTHSGDKYVSPVIESLLDNKTWALSKDVLLSRMIQIKYSQKWLKLWDALGLEYEIASPYNITEDTTRESVKDGTETVDSTNKQTGGSTLTNIKDLTSSDSGKVTDELTRMLTTDRTDYSFGFNSSNTDKDKSGEFESTEGGNSKTVKSADISNTLTGTDTDEETLNRTQTQNAVTDTFDKTNDTISVKKKGNLGINTIQNILTQEITLRQWEFFECVFKDIDKLLTLPIYGH